MKKTFCVLLAFLMLLPFCPVNSAVASLSDASLAFDGGGWSRSAARIPFRSDRLLIVRATATTWASS